MSQIEAQARKRGIVLFSEKDAPGLFASGTMSFPEFDAADQEAIKADGPRNPNLALGGHDAVLFRGDGEVGFNLVVRSSGRATSCPGTHTTATACITSSRAR